MEKILLIILFFPAFIFAQKGSGTIGSGNTGTVTSIGLTAPTGLTVSGSPVTGSGTIGLTNNLAAGFVKSAGVGGAFTSAAIAIGDIPSLSSLYLPITGGTLTGHLLFTDNTYDIGASGVTRPRTGYFGTSIVAPTVASGGNRPLHFNTNSTRRFSIPSSGITLDNSAPKLVSLSTGDSMSYVTELPASYLTNASDSVIVVNNFSDLTSAMGKNGNIAVAYREGAIYRKQGGTWSAQITQKDGRRALSATLTSGTFITPSTTFNRYQFELTGAGTVNNPSSIASFSSGDIYVIEIYNQTTSSKTVSFGTEYLDGRGSQMPTITVPDSSSMELEFKIMALPQGKRMVFKGGSITGGVAVLDGGNPAGDGFIAIGSQGSSGTGIYSDFMDSLRMAIQNTGGISFRPQHNATAAFRIYTDALDNFFVANTTLANPTMEIGDTTVKTKIIGDLIIPTLPDSTATVTIGLTASGTVAPLKKRSSFNFMHTATLNDTVAWTSASLEGIVIPEEFDGWSIVEVAYRTSGVVSTDDLGIQVTKQSTAGSSTGSLAGTITIGSRYDSVTGSFAVAAGDLVQTQVTAGTPGATGLTVTIVLQEN